MNGLFLGLLQSHPTIFFSVVVTVVVSITLHELAHGWMALRLGDNTPAVTGHMTLNPVVHMGIASIVMLLMFGIAFGSMPVDPTRLRGKYAEAWVAIAGPAVNLVLALLALLGLGLWTRFGVLDEASRVQMNAYTLLTVFGSTNMALMLFNLLPLPPLDGSRVVANLVPAYRNFMSGDMVRGVMSAVFFAMFLGGANFIYHGADVVSDRVLFAIAGREHMRMIAADAEEADAAPDPTPNPMKPANP